MFIKPITNARTLFCFISLLLVVLNRIMFLLEHENQIFLDIYEENALLILCEGLGLDRIFLNLIRLYTDLKELVLVLNTDEFQQKYYMQQLGILGVKNLPVTVTSDISAQGRQRMYEKGGVYFMSSRILVMDLLMERIPIDLITGIIVDKAHKMIDACQEAFILRLYREKNKNGFIKGLTDHPTMFLGEYAKLEKTMKSLFVGKVLLWPRFHASIISCLKKHEPEVVEISIPITKSMSAIQSCLLEIISACLQEIKTYNPGIDTEELSLEKSLGSSFDRSVRAQLDPVWNQIGSKTKNLVNDLRALRSLLRGLSQYDCVTFLKTVENICDNEKSFGKNTGWMFLDATDKLFYHARYRVHGDKTKEDSSKENPLLEEPPKWNILKEVLEDIEKANKETASTDLGTGATLICASDPRTIDMLNHFLEHDQRSTMTDRYRRLFPKLIPNSDASTAACLREPTASVSDSTPGDSADMLKCTSYPNTYLHALFGNADRYSLAKALEKLTPRFVVLYNNSLHFVRQLEVYKACKPGIPLRVYVLTYEMSTEEQIYLTSVKREKEAFHSLIREKSTMVIPKEIEGKVDHAPQLSRDPNPAYRDPNDTRKAGGQTSNSEQHKVIIDMREFRSELPGLLYKRGIGIDPVTLEVGDYIITPEICIERKSLADLVGSLHSGRLYTQCISMCRHYEKPMLMIEFDANKAFSFKARGILANTSIKELNQKLVLLLIHFPKLRLAWCPSPSVAAEFFHEIKVGKKQPDAQEAALKGSNATEGGVASTRSYNSGPYDLLLKLPGIDLINCKRILNHVKNLKELTTLSEKQLAAILDSKVNANLLFEFLHKDYSYQAVQPASKTTFQKRPFGGKSVKQPSNAFAKKKR